MNHMNLAELSIKEFLAKTASGSPVPGGGSIAALSAAIAASLAEMVAHLTIGKKGFATTEKQMKDIIKDATDFRNELMKDIDRDSGAYHDVLTAFKMPKGNRQEENKRKQTIQVALKNAALVPLDVAKKALKIIDLSHKVVKYGNKNAVTDGAVAAMMARTAVLSALYNVKINLASIEDVDFVKKIRKDVIRLEKEIENKERKILSGISI